MINFSLLDEAFPNDDKVNNKKKKMDKENPNANSCKPIQAPIYEVPNKCDNTGKFRKVIEDSMKETKMPNSDFKKDGVRAYDFDEFDAYVTINDIKTNNIDKTDEYRTTPFLVDYLKSLRNNFKKPLSESTDIYQNIEQFTNLSNGKSSNSLKVDVNLYNLFLFIFLGIIIIVLIDQINKLVEINQK